MWIRIMKVKVAQLSLTLCRLMDYSLPSSSDHGQDTGVVSHSLLQRIFPTQGSSQPGMEPKVSCIAGGFFFLPSESPGKPKNTGVAAYPSPTDLPNLELKPGSPALQADSWPAELPGRRIIKLAKKIWILNVNLEHFDFVVWSEIQKSTY